MSLQCCRHDIKAGRIYSFCDKKDGIRSNYYLKANFYITVFVILAVMRKAMKQISFLILALSLNLVWTVGSFNDIVFFHNQLSICSECPDTSDPLECFHSFCCEDDVFMNDPKVKSKIFNVRNDIVPVLKADFRNDYLDNIWQPPKFS
jgi:hypothetical protein